MASIKKNFLYNVLYQILLIVLPLITTPYISRVLGVVGIGMYTYTYTIANYFVLAAMLGVKNYGNRKIAFVRDNPARLSRTFWEIYDLQFFCALVSFAVYLFVMASQDTAYRTISLLQGIYVFSSLIDISWFFFGLEQFKITVTRNIMIRLGSLACVFLFVKDADDLWKYTLIMATGMLLSQVYLWFCLKDLIHWHRPRLCEIFRHLPSELLLFIPVIAVSLYKMMDKIMLKELSSFAQVGFYENSEKIINIPLGVITALGTVMLPRMSNIAAKKQTRQGRIYIHHSILFAMFLACGMTFGIAGIADVFVPFFFGDAFVSCILLMQVMTPTILFIAWANVIRTQYLIPNQKDRIYIVSVMLGAVCNLLINLALIPRYQAMGAVIGTIAAEGIVCIYQTWMVRKKLPVRHYIRDMIPFLFLGLGMYGLIRLIRMLPLPSVPLLLLMIGIGGTVYSVLSAVYIFRSHPSIRKNLLKK